MIITLIITMLSALITMEIMDRYGMKLQLALAGRRAKETRRIGNAAPMDEAITICRQDRESPRKDGSVTSTDGIQPSVLRPQPATVAKPLLGDRGATPLHYRAFSVMQHRLMTLDGLSGMVDFRNTAKTIKLHDGEHVRHEALAIMTTFARLVDAYAPVWEAAGTHEEPGDRPVLEREFLRKMEDLHDTLKTVLTQTASRDALDTITHYIDVRYAVGDVEKVLTPLD